MITAHYQGSKLLHVVVDEDGMRRLRELVPFDSYSVPALFQGIPIYRPGNCPCALNEAEGA